MTADSRYQQRETLADTDAIEAMASADFLYFEHTTGGKGRVLGWDEISDQLREWHLENARRMLDAARPLLPETRALERIRALDLLCTHPGMVNGFDCYNAMLDGEDRCLACQVRNAIGGER